MDRSPYSRLATRTYVNTRIFPHTRTTMFTGWDYAVFLFMLGVSLGIGVFHGFRGRKKTTTKEFLMAGGQMGVLPVSLSLLASFMSAIMVLGTPAEMYVYGTQYWMVCLGYAIMIPLAAHFFLPVFYRLNLTSVFEVGYCIIRLSPITDCHTDWCPSHGEDILVVAGVSCILWFADLLFCQQQNVMKI